MAAAMDANWLAHRYDEERDAIRFVRYERAERTAVPFLVDGHLPSRDYTAISRTDARTMRGDAPLHFVFHSGFCCSTLVSDCLDQPGLASSFSEPMILNDAVGLRLRGADAQKLGEVVDDALALLARPFAADPASVVKPSTVVNALAEAMMAIRPKSSAIVMYAPLTDYLTSIAKKGIDGRLWVRDLLMKCRAEGRLAQFGFSDSDLLGMTDLQAAAVGWLAQQAVFMRLLTRYPDRVRSLSSKEFLEQPLDRLEAVVELFGLGPLAENAREAMVNRLGRNSKDGTPFGEGDREAEYGSAYALHGDEIDKVSVWSGRVADAAGLPLDLPGKLR